MGNKYPILRPDKIISVLLSLGFVRKGQKGSHTKYSNGFRTVIIPMHDTIARGTLKSILVQAGIELEEFLELL
jgi:predicted RNA binding protein YcfA (HicA-like mRNA interferase family)